MEALEKNTIRIFLVDDHKAMLWGLERLIESAEPRMRVVGTAETCEELMAKMSAAKPDLVLLDLDLRGTSSLGCLEKLAARGAKDMRVLIFTGSSDPAVHQQAVMRGARGVVHKQVDASVLLRAIEKVHQGEIWLDRATLGLVMTSMASPERKAEPANKLDTLTAKEHQIVTTLVTEKGAPNKILADKLHMSEHTLRNHLTTIYDKLEVQGRMNLYLYASQHLQPAVA
jgi:two-component system nitrate/nitrite response regulator NarL